MLTKNETTFLSQKASWAVLLMLALAVLTMVFIPVWIIMPFKPQSQQGLELSFALRRWSPALTLVASAVGLILAVWLWRNSRRWWRKAALIIVLIPLLVSTWFARQNHFEWMFNPLANTAYAKATNAGFVADTDMVLAVENNNEAVAYPVRLMAYHHLVQDTVGGTPVVATY
jgi:uncharacterized BrkB/YihY/UPF0761 family membrane protein